MSKKAPTFNMAFNDVHLKLGVLHKRLKALEKILPPAIDKLKNRVFELEETTTTLEETSTTPPPPVAGWKCEACHALRPCIGINMAHRDNKPDACICNPEGENHNWQPLTAAELKEELGL